MDKQETLGLWEARFERLLVAETEACRAYKTLLDRYSHLLAGSRVRSMIRAIMKDEMGHVRIVKRLLVIVQKKHHPKK